MIQMAGRAMLCKPAMGKATQRATASALPSANCLGMSSPKTIVTKVSPKTTVARAMAA